MMAAPNAVLKWFTQGGKKLGLVKSKSDNDYGKRKEVNPPTTELDAFAGLMKFDSQFS